MFRYRFCSHTRLLLVWLLIELLLQDARSGLAASCRQDDECNRSFALAESLEAQGALAAALAELQFAHAQVDDPRLLVSIGNLYNRQGQSTLAGRYCRLSLDKGRDDAEVKKQATACIGSAHSEYKAKPAASSTPLREAGHKATSQNGPITLDGQVRNDVSIAPVFDVAREITVAPKIEITQPRLTATEPQSRRLYQRWWLWTGLGVLTAGVIGLGFALASVEPDTHGIPNYRIALPTELGGSR